MPILGGCYHEEPTWLWKHCRPWEEAPASYRRSRSQWEKIHSAFTKGEIELLWEHAADQNIQIVLIMVYTGMRIEELLSMKTENVHLDKK